MAGDEELLRGLDNEVGPLAREPSNEPPDGTDNRAGGRGGRNLTVGDRSFSALAPKLAKALWRFGGPFLQTVEETSDYILYSDKAIICVDILSEKDGEREPVILVTLAIAVDWKVVQNEVEALARRLGIKRIQFRSSTSPKVFERLIPEEERTSRNFRVVEYIYEWRVTNGQEKD